MFSKVFVVLAVVAASQAGLLPQKWEAAPQQWAPEPQKWAPEPQKWAPAPQKWAEPKHEEPANYEFNYEVHDEHTGDIKRQNEKAVNGVISGQYSLYDADGFRRVVEYTADDHNGFVANVRREPLQHQQKQQWAPKPQKQQWEQKPQQWAPKPQW
jgi:hypothetical protein